MGIAGGEPSNYIRAQISGKALVEALTAGKDVVLFSAEEEDNVPCFRISRFVSVGIEETDGVSCYICSFIGSSATVMYGYGDLYLVDSNEVARQMAIDAGLLTPDSTGR